MGLIDNIRARRAMRNNRINIPINTERFDNAIGKSTPTFVREEPKPMNIQVNSNAIDKSMSNIQLPTFQSSRPNPEIPEWQKYGFKSQDEMNFWINRAKSWSDGVLDTIDKVKQFQRANGLADDGKVGLRTIDVFNRINGIGQEFSNNSSSSNLGHPVFTAPLQTRKTSTNKSQTNTNSKSNNNTKYPILSNSWFANTFSSLSDQNFMNVGRDVVNLFTGQSNTDASKNNEINKDFYKNKFNEIIDLVKSIGKNRRIDSGGGMFLHKKGGTIKKFANSGQMGEFISFIKECVGINDDSQLKSFMQKIGKKGLAMFKQAYDKGMTPQQVRKALQSQNNASSAQQSSYMKKGGCIACEMQNGGRFKYTKQELQKANAKANVNQIPVLVNSLKCGGKTRKKLIKKR